MRVIVASGGTGGHIYPALAIINKVKEQAPHSQILYIGTLDRMEKDIVPKRGIPFIGLAMSGLDRKNPFANIKTLYKFIKAIRKARQIIKEFKPDIVIGVGGYITVPVLYAAHLEGIKSVIHEQNSIPGLSNKFLSKYVSKIFVSFPKSSQYFPKEKVIYTGNPRSEEIIQEPKLCKESLGLTKDQKLVIIVMGSLGSTTMTNKLQELIPQFKNKDYQVLVITGKNYYAAYKDIKIANVKIVPFLDNLINLLKDTSLLISRAGASTISEITAIGLPAILVPSPYVTHNHQYLNAKELEEAGACRIIEEKDFSYQTILPLIAELLSNKNAYAKMHNASLKMGIKNSADLIYQEIKEIVGETDE